MKKTLKKVIHEGDYMAEILVTLEGSSDEWAPYISVEDALRVDNVREALLAGDVVSAEKYATVYEVVPVSLKVAEESVRYGSKKS